MVSATAAQGEHVVGWPLVLTAGSFVLTWLYQGSGRSILLVAGGRVPAADEADRR